MAQYLENDEIKRMASDPEVLKRVLSETIVPSGPGRPKTIEEWRAMNDPAETGTQLDWAMALMGGPRLGPGGRLIGYHGSPHNFSAERLARGPKGLEYIVGKPDVLPELPPGWESVKDFPMGRMRMDKIGTGEGHQVYGHGLYLGEAEATALNYKNNLSKRNLMTAEPDATAMEQHGSDLKRLELLRQRATDRRDFRSATDISFDIDDLYDKMVRETVARNPNLRGQTYQVGIGARPEELLQYDKPLREQPYAYEALQAAAKDAPYGWFPSNRNTRMGLRRDIIANPESKGADAYGALSRLFSDTGEPAQASQLLKEKGIQGVRYLDQLSRMPGVSEPTYNYAIFNDKILDILKKYGLAGLAPGLASLQSGAYQPKEQQ